MLDRERYPRIAVQLPEQCLDYHLDVLVVTLARDSYFTANAHSLRKLSKRRQGEPARREVALNHDRGEGNTFARSGDFQLSCATRRRHAERVSALRRCVPRWGMRHDAREG